MISRQLALAVSALAQATRFGILRAPVAAVPPGGLSGVATGAAIGEGQPNTAVHVAELERAGLVLTAHGAHATFCRPEAATMRGFGDGLSDALGFGPSRPAAPAA